MGNHTTSGTVNTHVEYALYALACQHPDLFSEGRAIRGRDADRAAFERCPMATSNRRIRTPRGARFDAALASIEAAAKRVRA